MAAFTKILLIIFCNLLNNYAFDKEIVQHNFCIFFKKLVYFIFYKDITIQRRTQNL